MSDRGARWDLMGQGAGLRAGQGARGNPRWAQGARLSGSSINVVATSRWATGYHCSLSIYPNRQWVAGLGLDMMRAELIKYTMPRMILQN